MKIILKFKLLSFVIIFIFLITKSSTLYSESTKIDNLYVNTFGDQTNNPIIYLHGGPGYNSANFEFTTAEILSKNNYFVINYDRRGEGRSEDQNAKYNFDEALGDILKIMQKYNLNKVSLFGHSFGGMLAIKFAEKYPDKVNNIVLIGAPINLQQSFKHIISKCKSIYESKSDNNNLRYITMLEKMDTTTMQYASYCFMHAMQNGFYSPKEMTDDAKELYKLFSTNSTLKLYSTNMTQLPPMSFSKNENYTNLSLEKNIKNLVNAKINIFGIYGKEDGLYSEKQINDLTLMISKDNLKYYDNCSHNPFIDQQKMFIDDVNKWLK